MHKQSVKRIQKSVSSFKIRRLKSPYSKPILLEKSDNQLKRKDIIFNVNPIALLLKEWTINQLLDKYQKERKRRRIIIISPLLMTFLVIHMMTKAEVTSLITKYNMLFIIYLIICATINLLQIEKIEKKNRRASGSTEWNLVLLLSPTNGKNE
ncbi:hypothetical protein BpHYR1_018078 [Brachionus plicatilis]|uniref:Uncharacterized protein n=1 Tax=Brachionus plicatilis TaxID=10195 RepID=A0A3M7R731_BRAPC|nr:hypothetical protein BpHYR1_018078 [Brachionus plicatilis]